MPQTNTLNTITIKPPNIEGKVQNGVATISFIANAYETYYLYELANGNEILIETIKGKEGLTEFCVRQPANKITRYTIRCGVKNYKTQEEILSQQSNVLSLFYE